MDDESGLMLLVVLGIGAAVWWFVFRNPRNVGAATNTVAQAAPPSDPTIQGNPLYSSNGLIPGARNPLVFQGQNGIERRFALAGKTIGTAVASRVPYVGPLARQTAGVDTQVNITQGERSVHGAVDIGTGHVTTGVREIAGSAVTAGVQPLKSAYGAGKSVVNSIVSVF